MYNHHQNTFRFYFITGLVAFLLLANGSLFAQQAKITDRNIIDLAGQWRFQSDPGDIGLTQRWYSSRLNDVVKLPGSMTENNKGEDVSLQTKWTASIYDSSFFFRPSLAKYRQPGNIKIPFWLTPNKYYVGAAWYQRDIIIPQGWEQQQVILFLERCHFYSRVWIDGREAGSSNSLVAPHEFNLGKLLAPGKHTITIRVDNSINKMNVGPDSHSVSDHTQGNWNGIVGKMFLQALPLLHLYDIQVYPDIKNRRAKIKITVVNSGDKRLHGAITMAAKSFNSKRAHVVPTGGLYVEVPAGDTSLVEFNLPLGSKMLLWDEFDPALYKLTVTINADGIKEKQVLQFGMREIKANGNKLEVNGKAVYLRGNLNNCEFPLTGYAPMDVESWRRIYKVAKAHGLNHLRFHSWCPPEAAFIAADEAGFYLQPEGPTWPNHGTSLGDGRFIDQYVYDETNRMEKNYGNYASYCMLAAGNEPAGRNQASYLGQFVRYWQAKDNRRVYTGASVAMSWPLYPESDFMIKSGPRNLNWTNTRPETKTDYRAAIEKFTMPYVTHEMGQWCVFPNFKEIKKYTGVTRAKNFELFREDLADHGMGDQAEGFLMASGKLQALCYKQEIEKSLRTRDGAGFQLLGLQDFPGQGTALVGVLDAFWEEKGYISAKEWSRFCNSTVPLSRIKKFVFTNNETFEADIEIYHFGKEDLNSTVSWTIKDDNGKMIKSSSFPAQTIKRGQNTSVGKVSMPLTKIKDATKLNLEVSIQNTTIANDWSFWVYPERLETSNSPSTGGGWGETLYTTALDANAESVLNSGGKVFLDAASTVIKGKEIVMQFTPVFWNTSWFKMRPPHVTGFVAQNKHPLFKYFPTEYYSDLQWWEIVNKAQVMHLEDFPKAFRPIVQPIDTWFMNRKLGLIYEAKVGNGKLIVSTANLSDTTGPAARQLLYSIKQYMASAQFDPKDAIPFNIVKDVFQTPSKEVWSSFTNATPDELKPQNQKIEQK
jgi:hypothetical protein